MKHSDFETVFDYLTFGATQVTAQDDQPTIFFSFAREDAAHVDRIRKHLDPLLKHTIDPVTKRPLKAWAYSNRDGGTALGEHFPSVIASRMWTCRGAILLLGPNYMSSAICHDIELPFLLWRQKAHQLRLFPIRLNTTSVDNRLFKIPAFQGPSEFIKLSQIVDDRSPSLTSSNDFTNEATLEQLLSEQPYLAERRIAAFVEQMCALIEGDMQTAATLDPIAVPAADLEVPATDVQIKPEEAASLASPMKVEVPGPVASPQEPTSSQETGKNFWRASIAGTCLVLVVTTAWLAMNLIDRANLNAEIADRAARSTSSESIQRDLADSDAQEQQPHVLPSVENREETQRPDETAEAEEQGKLSDQESFAKGYAFLRNDGCATRQSCGESAFAVFEALADAGNAIAQSQLGTLYKNQVGVLDKAGSAGCLTPKECDVKAVRWFFKAAAKGLEGAQVQLAKMFDEERGVFDRPRSEQLRCDTGSQCRERAIYWYTTAYGNSEANQRLAELLPDAQPSEMIKRSIAQKFDLADRFLHADGGCGEKDDCDMAAADVLYSLSKGGNLEAQLKLANLYLDQTGVLNRPEDFSCSDARECDQRAAAWLLTAASQGLGGAQFQLATLFHQQRGVMGPGGGPKCNTADVCRQKALYWFTMAHGQPGAAEKIQELSGHSVDSAELSARADDQKLAQGFEALKLRGDCKEARVPCMSAAVRIFYELAEAGNAIAQLELGSIYVKRFGVLRWDDPKGCKNDEDCDEQAVEWFSRSAAQGLADGKFELANMFEAKRGVLGRKDDLGCVDEAQCQRAAVSWYEKTTELPQARKKLEALKAQDERKELAMVPKVTEIEVLFVDTPPALPQIRGGFAKYESFYNGNNAFEGGWWSNSHGGSTWAEYNFKEPVNVGGIYIGEAGSDVTSSGSKISLQVRNSSTAAWREVFHLEDQVIKRGFSGGAVGPRTKSVFVKLPPQDLAGIRIDMEGNGWFFASDVRVLGPGE